MAIYGYVLIPGLLGIHCPKIKAQLRHLTVLEAHSMSNDKLCNFCWNEAQELNSMVILSKVRCISNFVLFLKIMIFIKIIL